MDKPFILILAALKNVPFDGEGNANANGAEIDHQDGDAAVVTETWDQRTKDAIRAANPHLDWLTGDGQSVMLGHNPQRFKLLDSGIIPAGNGQAIEGLNDRRDMPFKILQDRITGKLYCLLGIHTPPVRPALGIKYVLAARAAHAVTRARIRLIMRRRRALVVAAGDWNDTHLVKVLTVVGGSIANGIVHGEVEDGVQAGQVIPFSLHSDHTGEKIYLAS